MESIFEKRLTVTPDYCDASGALSPLAAFTIFQGIAAQHAEVLGVGSSAMAKKGEFWLTVHTRVDLFERAYLMDELTVRTWAEACSERDVRTYRSYTLSRGEAVIARGKTEWAILGPEQKIIRFGDSGFPKDYPFPAETAIPEKLQRFHEKFEDADLFSHYAVRSTDIDLGHHMNNVAYVRLLLDCFSALSLGAESVTVHTLCLKTGAYMVTRDNVFDHGDIDTVNKMVDFSREYLSGAGYVPYYMYRQGKSLGNLENVGWSKPGSECLYNVFMMDETHTVLAVGAGAVTRLKNPVSGKIERIYNYKYPYEYISGFDNMLKRKEKINSFYKDFINMA